MAERLTTDALLELLRSPDPRERDELAFEQLAERIGVGEEDEALTRLGDALVERLSDSEVHVRSFAVLVLAEIVERDRVTAAVDPSAFRYWFDRTLAWYRAEPDQQGWDATRGWLHAVAHGADALGAFGHSPRLDAADATSVLATASARMLGSEGSMWVNQEDDRVAYAMAVVLSRRDLDERAAVDWLQPIRAALGPVQARRPAWAMNTSGTLRMLYLLADRGFAFPDGETGSIPHRAALLEALAETIRLGWPYLR